MCLKSPIFFIFYLCLNYTISDTVVLVLVYKVLDYIHDIARIICFTQHDVFLFLLWVMLYNINKSELSI